MFLGLRLVRERPRHGDVSKKGMLPRHAQFFVSSNVCELGPLPRLPDYERHAAGYQSTLHTSVVVSSRTRTVYIALCPFFPEKFRQRDASGASSKFVAIQPRLSSRLRHLVQVWGCLS